MSAAQTLADVTAAYLMNAQRRLELRESSERARETSLHDALTGLPNRTLLVQRLDHAIQRCLRSDKRVAILFADLDRFKSVNDIYGHHVGDELLVAVAQRLLGLIRPGDTLARLADDEFIILCEDLDDDSVAEPLAVRIGTALSDPFVLSGTKIQVSASVGIAFAGPGCAVPERVLQDADTAMYQAKRRGGGRHGIIDLREQRLADHRSDLTRDLGEAVARNELRTEYQPIVSTAEGTIIGAEALLRWQHRSLGVIGPDTAIPLAEQSGLITEIGRWVLEQACLDRRSWCRPERADLDISVNVSPHQLMAPDFAATVAAVLSQTQTDPALLTLEVTESVFIQDSERALVVLRDLKDLGVRLALDDFGTGYSSLGYLMRFPVDVVKIDRSFVADLGRDSASRLIVGAIVGLAHGLQMTVVAEGVESAKLHGEVATLMRPTPSYLLAGSAISDPDGRRISAPSMAPKVRLTTAVAASVNLRLWLRAKDRNRRNASSVPMLATSEMTPFACSIVTRLFSAPSNWVVRRCQLRAARSCSSARVAAWARAWATTTSMAGSGRASVMNRFSVPSTLPRTTMGNACTEGKPTARAMDAKRPQGLVPTMSPWTTACPVRNASRQGPSSFWIWNSSKTLTCSLEAAITCRSPRVSATRIPVAAASSKSTHRALSVVSASMTSKSSTSVSASFKKVSASKRSRFATAHRPFVGSARRGDTTMWTAAGGTRRR